MTNPINRRLVRLESEIEKRTDPGYGPVFKFIDDPRDPENARRLEEAERFRRDHLNGLIIRHLIVYPPNGAPNWEHVSREERATAAMTPLPQDLLVNGAKIFVMRLRQIGCRGHHAEWVKGNGGRGFSDAWAN